MMNFTNPSCPWLGSHGMTSTNRGSRELLVSDWHHVLLYINPNNHGINAVLHRLRWYSRNSLALNFSDYLIPSPNLSSHNGLTFSRISGNSATMFFEIVHCKRQPTQATLRSPNRSVFDLIGVKNLRNRIAAIKQISLVG